MSGEQEKTVDDGIDEAACDLVASALNCDLAPNAVQV
jgi:hypothetical protein